MLEHHPQVTRTNFPIKFSMGLPVTPQVIKFFLTFDPYVLLLQLYANLVRPQISIPWLDSIKFVKVFHFQFDL